MEYTIEKVAGMECIMIQEGTHLTQIPLDTIGSWGVLLGESDPGVVLERILTHQEQGVDPGEPNMWTPLYEGLLPVAESMARAGVPVEFMEVLMDEELGAPVPGRSALRMLSSVRSEGVAALEEVALELPVDEAMEALKEELRGDLLASVEARRAKFLDHITPKFGSESEA